MDNGYYFHYYNRIHIPLQTNPDCLFQVGPDKERWKEENMKVGSVYEINNSRNHSAQNNGATDRFHLIIDMKLGRKTDDAA